MPHTVEVVRQEQPYALSGQETLAEYTPLALAGFDLPKESSFPRNAAFTTPRVQQSQQPLVEDAQ